MNRRPLVLNAGAFQENTSSDKLLAEKILFSDEFFKTRNDSGSSIASFKIVKAAGHYNTENIITINSISALTDIPVGITTASFADATTADILQKGILTVTGFNTTASTIGNKVYCNVTGDLTLTETDILVGIVLTLAANGVIFFNTDKTKLSTGGGGEEYFTAVGSPGIAPTAAGTDAVAIGDGAVASGANSLAFGTSSQATASRSIGFGGGSSSQANAIAIGYSAGASGIASIAIGQSTSANSTNALALGFGAAALSSNTISIGNFAQVPASATGGISIGDSATISGAVINCVAIGKSTSISGATGIAIGLFANVSAAHGVAIGSGSSAITSARAASYSVAIGRDSAATSLLSIAIGPITRATATHTVAIGYNAQTSQVNAIAIGRSTNSSNLNAISIGNAATCSAYDGVSIGRLAGANSNYAVAIGRSASATGQRSIAIGRSATSNGSNATCIGSGRSFGSGAIAIGTYSAGAYGAMNTYTIAIGRFAFAPVPRGIAIGAFSKAGSYSSIAIGSSTATSDNARAEGDFCIAIGLTARTGVGLTSAIAIGRLSLAGNNYAIALGDKATTAVTRTIQVQATSIVRKDTVAVLDSTTETFQWGAGNEAILITKEIDLKTAGTKTIDVPTGSRFYVTEVGLILTTRGTTTGLSDGTITTQPIVSFGNFTDTVKFVSLTTSALSTIYERDKYDPLTTEGEVKLSFTVGTIAAGSLLVQGRAYFKGVLMETQV